MKKKLFLLCCFLLPFICLNAQPVCNGTLGEPILNLTFGQGNATQTAYSPLSTYAPGLSTHTMFQSSGGLTAANTTGLVKNSSVFGPSGYWVQSNDHTGNPYGLLLGINMPDNIGDTVVEYLMTNLCPNTTLQYSIWLLNLMDPNHPLVVSGASYIEYPNMIMRILDLSNNVLGTFTTGNVPHDGIWHQYAFLFSNGNNATVKLQLINNTSGSGYGNDVALDDITVRPCVPIAHILPKLDTTLCQSALVNFTANITSGVYSASNYQWQYSSDQGATWINGNIPSSSNIYNFSFSEANAPGEYWIRYLVGPGAVNLSNNCHAISDTSKIRIDSIAPEHLPNDTTMCSNGSLHLSGANPDAASYQWNTGANTSDISVSTPGTYWVKAISLYGCVSSDSIHVDITPVSNYDLGPDTSFCEGSSYTLDVSNLNADHYLWNTGSTAPSIVVTTSGVYSVTALVKGCNTSDSVNISFTDFPQVELMADTTICEGSQLILQSSVIYPDAHYLWSNGSTNPAITIAGAGTYSLTVTRPPDCSGTDSVTIKTSKCDCDLMVPNAFSPNGDGLNDIYKPRLINAGCPLKGYRLYIYNRWGQVVYFTTNYERGWDGNYNGKYADAGTYMYYISFTDWATQKEKSYKGDLTLLR